MLLKSLSRKSGTRQILNYLFKDKEKLVTDKSKPLIIRKNVRSRTLDKVERKEPAYTEFTKRNSAEMLWFSLYKIQINGWIFRPIKSNGAWAPIAEEGRITGVRFEGDRKFRFNSLGYKDKISRFEVDAEKDKQEMDELSEIRDHR